MEHDGVHGSGNGRADIHFGDTGERNSGIGELLAIRIIKGKVISVDGKGTIVGNFLHKEAWAKTDEVGARDPRRTLHGEKSDTERLIERFPLRFQGFRSTQSEFSMTDDQVSEEAGPQGEKTGVNRFSSSVPRASRSNQ
jgi:hypothetical protein